MKFRTFVVSLAVDVRVDGWRGATACLVGGGEHEGCHIGPVYEQARREGGGRRTPAARLVQACTIEVEYEDAGARQKGRMKRLLFEFTVPWIKKVTVRTVEGRFGVVPPVVGPLPGHLVAHGGTTLHCLLKGRSALKLHRVRGGRGRQTKACDCTGAGGY